MKDFTLHSIMFLLIPQGLAEQFKALLALHSIMFLLIPGPQGDTGAKGDVFTFHNVSINTGFDYAQHTNGNDLYIP